jgi:hypothetical protein
VGALHYCAIAAVAHAQAEGGENAGRALSCAVQVQALAKKKAASEEADDATC